MYKREKRLNLLDSEGQTPLHLAIMENEHSLIQKYLKQGAGVNIKNKWGVTPLQLQTLLKPSDFNKNNHFFYFKSQQERKSRLISTLELEEQANFHYIKTMEFEDKKDLFWTLSHYKDRSKDKILKTIDFQQSQIKNRWLLGAHQNALEKGQIENTSYAIEWINSSIGYGVFVEKDLPEFTFIGNYIGCVKNWHNQSFLKRSNSNLILTGMSFGIQIGKKAPT